MATLAEMRVKVAEKLELTAQGQALTAADAALIDARITEKHDNLAAKGRIYWDASDTPTEAVVPMVWILANEVADEFGLWSEKLELKAQQAMIDIAELNGAFSEGEPIQALYY